MVSDKTFLFQPELQAIAVTIVIALRLSAEENSNFKRIQILVAIQLEGGSRREGRWGWMGLAKLGQKAHIYDTAKKLKNWK